MEGIPMEEALNDYQTQTTACDNVRRVAPIGGNLRYTITSKTDQTVQCESF